MTNAAEPRRPGGPRAGPTGRCGAEAGRRGPRQQDVPDRVACLPDPAPVLAAARGFAEGNGYLTGQVVDRRA